LETIFKRKWRRLGQWTRTKEAVLQVPPITRLAARSDRRPPRKV